MNWSWLYGWVASIDDIIADQAVDQEFDSTDTTLGGDTNDTEFNTI